jgi:Tfp pilus assembly protein PilF/transcriptional regulator with XRE-family HTH domain
LVTLNAGRHPAEGTVRDGQTQWLDADRVLHVDDLALVLRQLRRREARQRRDAEVTYRQLAAKTGWSHAVIGQYFTGKVLPPTDRFDILIGLLGATPAEQGALATARDRVEESGRAPTIARGNRPRPVPRQLPADVSGFAGRDHELAELTTLLDAGGQASAIVISALSGTAGIGKTALAVHWAHRMTGRFDDGQLYVNLRGFDPGGTAMIPAEALRGFLEALEVPADSIPADLPAQVNLYRSLLAGKRMLVLLDNARDAEQIRPLLPGAPGCLVLVTSRNRLTSLVAIEGAHPLTVDLFDPAQARQLLAARLGAARVAAEPDAVEQIIALCARLPLALAIMAARAAVQPRFPLAVLANRLRDSRSGRDGDALDALDGGDPVTDLRAVFSWSYHTLSPPAARLFRLLGLHPGPDLDVPAAASLAGVPATGVDRLLAELTDATLVSEHSPGRYAFHDLLRAHAIELAADTGSERERHAAVRRALDHYVHTAAAATHLLDPYQDQVTLPAPQPGVTLAALHTHPEALAWFAREHPVLLGAIVLATRYGFDAHAWQLAATVRVFFERRGHWHDLVATQGAGLDAANRLADRTAQARSRSDLARAYAYLGNYDDAGEHLQRALELFEELGDRVGQANTRLRLGGLLALQGRHPAALDHARQAWQLYRAVGHQDGCAKALNNIGWYHAQLGEYRETLIWCGQALAQHRKLGDRRGQADTLDSLGYAHLHLVDHEQAAACYREAIELFGQLGDRYNESYSLNRLGDVRLAAGDPGAARAAWHRALAILTDLDHPDGPEVRTKLRTVPDPA